MSDNLTMGFFAFGAVLILISLLGGGFNIFSIGVSTTISNPVIRFTAFILGAGFILLALNPAIISSALTNSTATPLSIFTAQPQPTPTDTLIILQTTQPSPSPTSTAVPDTPAPSRPNPVEFVISYWQNVSDKRYENAWAQLSPGFRQANHNNDYNSYVLGYQQMNLCSIVVSNVELIRQDVYSAVAWAHFTYYAGTQCNSSEYNFEMWLIYDASNNTWLFDKNMKR